MERLPGYARGWFMLPDTLPYLTFFGFEQKKTYLSLEIKLSEMIPTSHLGKLYRGSWGNCTDLYQLTMAYGYWKQSLHQRKAVFHLFFRRHPFGGNYTMAAGLALAADFLQHFRYSAEEVQYLGRLKGADGKPLFEESFLHYLQRLRFTGQVDAIPEGTLVHPHQPLLRIEAPLAQAQLVETGLLTLINFSSLIATKARRITQAAQGDPVLEFGLRRAQGLDGGLTASRAAYIGGCAATSNVWAGQLLNIPVKGTHAHSWVMVYESELDAFREYARALPNNCVLLVDTYDTVEGVEHAIQVGKELRQSGHELLGLRLDSGDLGALSQEARRRLDAAGFPDTQIVASNDLDEHKIDQLKAAGAPITTWGVGTRLATASDQPALGGVYKLAALENEAGEWDFKIKLSEQAIKTSNPGRQQVRRFLDKKGYPVADLIFDVDHPPASNTLWDLQQEQWATIPEDAEFQDLLQAVFREGELVYPFPSLDDIREISLGQRLPFGHRLNKNYISGLSEHLYESKKRLIEQRETIS